MLNLLALTATLAHTAPPPHVYMEVSKDHRRTWWVVQLDDKTANGEVRVVVDGKCAAVRMGRPYRFRLSGKNWKRGTHHRICVSYRDADENEVRCEDVVISL